MTLELECDTCKRKEYYTHESEFFQDGIMHGMRGEEKDQIHCINCLDETERS